ncbi:MAG: diacylglycerol kinase family protein [Verrucomicrobiales bacterium]
MKSFLCAFRGLAVLFCTQRNARVHLFFLVLAVACGFFFRISFIEWCLILLASGMVLAAEGLNTGLELLADVVHPERHPQVGRMKDMAAGAVLIAAITAVGVGIMIFLPKFISWIAPN